MGEKEPLSLSCPECGKAILAVYRPDPQAKTETPNRFECPWCHREAMLYVPGWLAEMVKKRFQDDGDAGMIRLVVPRLRKRRVPVTAKHRSAAATKAARTRKRRTAGRKAAKTKRRKAGARKAWTTRRSR